ncbi:MAG: hypothetical protein LBK99_17300 [Opitutaceae bacterium]|jgi:hypothetical protein|nr:hypothetical protein [Opitutaceae bacterium]
MLFQRLSLRPVLFALSLSLASLVAIAAAAPRPAAIELAAPGVTLRADRWNHVTINTPQGDTLLTFSGFQLKWTPSFTTNGGTLRTVTGEDGARSLEIAYQLPAPSAAAAPALPKITGRFTPRPGRVEVTFDISDLPATIPNPKPDSDPEKNTIPVNIGGSMFERSFKAGAKQLPAVKTGLWKHNEHGGLPQEHPDGQFIRYETGDHIVSFAHDTGVNTQWIYERLQHIGLRKVSENHYIGKFTLLVSPRDGEWPSELLAARLRERPVGLKIGTAKTWNWWEHTTPADPLALDITLANTGPGQTPRNVVLKHWIRDYAGAIVSQAARPLALAPGVLHHERLPFSPSKTSPDSTRDLFFAEVSISDKTTGEELAFDRTHITLLPPHEFAAMKPDDSIIGLSAWWAIPDREQIARLIRRMGVRWLRHGKTGEFPGVTAILHDNIDWKKDYTDAERETWIRKEIQRCLDNGSRVWEFGNEINFAGFNIGLADTIKGKERRERLTKYIDWLREIRRIQKEMGSPATDIKLLTTGLAGMDVPVIEGLHQLGGWDLLDGIALHPGRGNFAVDYPVYDPPARIDTWDDWKNRETGAHGSYWNYYGSIITAKALINRYDAQKPADDPARKTLWLTEVYSPGHPNSWWEDTPRVGGENAILTFALAHAEGVKAAFWYQLYDSIWFDQLGINPGEREYSFGLIRRDLGFKPSLLGFVTAAETLDCAVFKGWIQFPGKQNAKTRGLLFDTPGGPVAILWDRTEGYTLTRKADPFPTPEPWIENWKTRTPVTLPAIGASIVTRNAIGQQTTHRTSGGSVILKLTGAPTIIYGLDPARLPPR